MQLLPLAMFLKPLNFPCSSSLAMLSFLGLAALLLTTAGASPITHITSESIANLTTTGPTVRIIDTNAFQFILDPGYPQAPEFTPVNGAPALATGNRTNQDAGYSSRIPSTH
jgi:hypothetical protein